MRLEVNGLTRPIGADEDAVARTWNEIAIVTAQQGDKLGNARAVIAREADVDLFLQRWQRVRDRRRAPQALRNA